MSHPDSNFPCIGEQWYHYKHKPELGDTNYLYEIVALGYGTEDDFLYVVYRPLYEASILIETNSSVYVRLLDNFLSDVVLETGEKRKRFIKRTS